MDNDIQSQVEVQDDRFLKVSDVAKTLLLQVENNPYLLVSADPPKHLYSVAAMTSLVLDEW